MREQTQVKVNSRESCYQSVQNIYLTHGRDNQHCISLPLFFRTLVHIDFTY